jgi:hypothetical protein
MQIKTTAIFALAHTRRIGEKEQVFLIDHQQLHKIAPLVVLIASYFFVELECERNETINR